MYHTQVTEAAAEHLKESGVTVKAYGALLDEVKAIAGAGKSLWVDPAQVRNVDWLIDYRVHRAAARNGICCKIHARFSAARKVGCTGRAGTAEPVSLPPMPFMYFHTTNEYPWYAQSSIAKPASFWPSLLFTTQNEHFLRIHSDISLSFGLHSFLAKKIMERAHFSVPNMN